MKPSIKGTFSKVTAYVALSLTSIFGAVNCTNEPPPKEQDGLSLTAKEAGFARVITIGNFLPHKVRKIFVNEVDSFAAATATGNKITFYGPPEHYHSPDYSDDVRNIPLDGLSPFRAGLFAHEVIHTMQFQLKWFGKLPPCPTTPNRLAAYKYDLDTVSSFMDLCVEQQARMVENYVRKFLHPKPIYLDADGDGYQDDDNKLKAIVEAVMPDIQQKWLSWIVHNPVKGAYGTYWYSSKMSIQSNKPHEKKIDESVELEPIRGCSTYEAYQKQDSVPTP